MRFFTNPVTGLIAAAGDILQGSSAGVLERLAIGSTGQELVPISGKEAWVTPARAPTAFASPTATSSLVGLMAGLAASFTPTKSGKILILAQGSIANNTLLDGWQVGIRYGTGSAPANGAALTGTVPANSVNAIGISSTANAYGTFTLVAIVLSLAIGTTYWIDLSQAASTGGTVQMITPSISVVEL